MKTQGRGHRKADNTTIYQLISDMARLLRLFFEAT